MRQKSGADTPGGVTTTATTPATTTPATDGLLRTSDSTEYGATRDNITANAKAGSAATNTDTLRGVVLMRVRLHSPVLGRFLQVDPVLRGSSNAFDHAGQDPINKFDLDGKCWRHCHWGRWASNAWHGARAVINIPSTAVGLGYAYARGGSCSRSSGLTVNCQGVGGANGSGGFTIGNVWLHKQRNQDYDPEDLRGLMRHERRHSDQYAIFGGFLGFPALYAIDRAIHRNPRKSWFERWAGLRDGNY